MERNVHLFLVDDEPGFGELIAKAFRGGNIQVELFVSGREALAAMKAREYDVGIIDIHMPDMNGIDLLKKLKESGIRSEIIMLTGYGSVASAIEAMRLGAYDYLTKPIRIDELEIVVRKACEKKELARENLALREELQMSERFHGLIGSSPKMRHVFRLIEKVAKTPSPVLITGESGTGKELAARAVHKSGDRADRPFIIIDCASLSETLLENELFGHEKGAFTDASAMKRGLFEVADGGTLFIDEIGEMKLSTQAKLLRVIETHQFRRLGSTRQIEADVRIISATNRDLGAEIRRGGFREDLYYRLNVFHIEMPPLRERKEDITLLARHFIANSQVTAAKKRIREEDLKRLADYDWPGNVRELANAIERAIIVSSNEYLTAADFPIAPGTRPERKMPGDPKRGLSEQLAEREREILAAALAENGGSKQAAAKMLKISRAKLYRKLSRYGLISHP